METKNLIWFNGRGYFLEKNNLYESDTNRRINEQNYLFANNYGTKPYNVLAIENTVFFVYPDKVKKIPTTELLQEKQAEIFYTEGTGDEDGNDTYVFIRRANSKRLSLLGRSLQEITENVYKIGKYAYQVINGQLCDMCPCTEFETFRDLLEIQTGEQHFGTVFVYKKTSKGWEKIREFQGTSIRSRNIDINF